MDITHKWNGTTCEHSPLQARLSSFHDGTLSWFYSCLSQAAASWSFPLSGPGCCGSFLCTEELGLLDFICTEGDGSQTSTSRLDPFSELQTHAGAAGEVPKLLNLKSLELSSGPTTLQLLGYFTSQGKAPPFTLPLAPFFLLTSTSSKLPTLKSPPKCRIHQI